MTLGRCTSLIVPSRRSYTTPVPNELYRPRSQETPKFRTRKRSETRSLQFQDRDPETRGSTPGCVLSCFPCGPEKTLLPLTRRGSNSTCLRLTVYFSHLILHSGSLFQDYSKLGYEPRSPSPVSHLPSPVPRPSSFVPTL